MRSPVAVSREAGLSSRLHGYRARAVSFNNELQPTSPDALADGVERADIVVGCW